MANTPFSDQDMDLGFLSDAGRSGKRNEDAVSVFSVSLQERFKLAAPITVAVVADGIGGSNAGEVASRIAIDMFRQVMMSDPETPISERLEQAVIAANNEVVDAACLEAGLRGMGTTIVAAAIDDTTLFLVHVGDSRAYLVRENVIFRLTLDHTWAQEAIDIGRLTPEVARIHPNRNVIKRFLGIDDEVKVDHQIIDVSQPIDENELGTHRVIDRLPLMQGDMVLLCSDGLTDELSDEEVEHIVAKYSNRNSQIIAQHLVSAANSHGGRDNITVVVIRRLDVTDLSQPPRPASFLDKAKSYLRAHLS